MTVASVQAAISAEIVGQHIEKAAAGLAKRDCDALVVFRNSNILGFCGVPLGPSDRLVCGLISREGQVGFIVPAFEAAMAGSLPAGSELAAWEEHEDPYRALAHAAARLGVDRGKILLDGFTWASVQGSMAAALPGATLSIDRDLIDGIRIIKSAEEIEAVRGACEDTGKIYPLIARFLRAGISELDLQREALSQLSRVGVATGGELIQGGENASVPHQPTGSRRFLNGDAVIVDYVAHREGYRGDMTRTFGVGDVSIDVQRAYAAVREAQAAAIKAIQPGVTCESVDRIARSVIERAWLGEFFVHRLGHGIGIDIHEPPYLVRGNKTVLEAGMCMTVEPGVYVPGQFGIRIEDVVTVTETGCTVLTSAVPTDVSAAFAP